MWQVMVPQWLPPDRIIALTTRRSLLRRGGGGSLADSSERSGKRGAESNGRLRAMTSRFARRLDRHECVISSQVFPGQDVSPRGAGQSDAAWRARLGMLVGLRPGLARLGASLGVCVLLAGCSAPPADEHDVTTVLETFYTAMKTGDTAAAMQQIAPDAVFVESGKLETRAEYEANHLPLDIAFEKQVTGKRGPWRTTM